MSAIEYYITDGNKFIKQGVDNQFKTVTNISIADVWDRSAVAKAVLDNSVPRAWRGKFYVAKYINGELIKCTQTQSEKYERREELTSNNEDKVEFELELYSFDEDEGVQKLIQGFDKIAEMLASTENLKPELEKEIATLDFMYEDLKHYCLKKKLGTVDSYKFKSLGDALLKKRMSLKNQLDILNKINQHREVVGTSVKDITKTIKMVKNKKYRPRVMVELFKDGIDAAIKKYMEDMVM